MSPQEQLIIVDLGESYKSEKKKILKTWANFGVWDGEERENRKKERAKETQTSGPLITVGYYICIFFILKVFLKIYLFN